MKAEHQRLIQLVLLVLVVIVIGLLVWWSELRDAGLVDGREEIVLPTPNCNPRGLFCLSRDRGYSISLELDRDATYLSPFSVRVKLFGFSWEQLRHVRVRFAMPDMYMGENQIVLVQAAPDGSEWQGEAVLPVCLTGRRDWVATVLVEGEERVIRSDFAFVIDTQ